MSKYDELDEDQKEQLNILNEVLADMEAMNDEMENSLNEW